MSNPHPPYTDATDSDLPRAISAIAEEAGRRLLSTFDLDARPASRDDLLAAMRRNETLVTRGLRDALAALRPSAAWWDDENDSEPLPGGEWWVVDTVEGNINHVHGLREWGVTITLVRDRQPVAAVVHQPLEALTWTAIRGGGTRRNGRPVRVSAKTRLDAAIATTGQAEAGQTGTYARIGSSVSAMLGQALLVRMAVPSTFLLLQLAEGQSDVFWQYAPSLPGIAAGLLMVTEAGGVASRLDGTTWQLGAADILLTTPALQDAAVAALRNGAIAEAA
jgi:myo-inositol-1(or 4)-monophosphatase